MFDDNFKPLSPVNYFQIRIECNYLEGNLNAKNYKKYLLPSTTELTEEEQFADLSMGWNRDGLFFYLKVNQPFRHANYPDITRGDSIELFIDTRDVKTSGYNTRFCHHFFFLPEAIEGHNAGEITKFRTEDIHELCNQNELQTTSELSLKHYFMQIAIPNSCLHGYDPDQFDRIGFNYRINRSGGQPQHFSVLSSDYQIEQQPGLWSSMRLVK